MRANSSLFLVLQTLLLAGAALAQETPPAEVPDAPPSVEAGDEASAGDGEQETDSTAEDEEDLYDFDISDLDDQTYEEDDDGFVPTEEIPADEPIPFPTDI
jgi:hypothetical protein